MFTFDDNEEEYLDWISTNPHGYVLNVDRNRRPHYTVLHQASCGYISSEKRTNYTCGDYLKLCSSEKSELSSWVVNNAKGSLRSCKCLLSARPVQIR